MEIGTKFRDIKDMDDFDEIWVLTKNQDLHNCEAKLIGNDEASWIFCIHPDCKDNVIKDILIV